MEKMLIITMDNQYPFSQWQHNRNNTCITVRQSIPLESYNRYQVISKATFLKNLRNKNLIKVHSIQQQQNCLHILYEYIHEKVTEQKEYLITQQIQNLTTYFSNIGVKTKLQRTCIGLSDQQHVKYFLGLDFQWESNADDSYLHQYYRQQLAKLQLSCKRNMKETSLVPVGHGSGHPPRKISCATLPSRYNRLAQIDKQLTNIRSPHKELPQQVSQIFQQFMQPPNLLKHSPPKHPTRKYSDNPTLSIMSSTKLIKDSDIQSQMGKHGQTIQRHRAETETINSKTKIQQLKIQQYQQITKSNKNYLQDFISVLEDQPTVREFSTEEHQSETLWNDATVLQNKAKQAVNNSLKAIQKFKSLAA